MSAPLIKGLLAVAAVVGGGFVVTHMSAGGVSVAGPVCLAQTASPGGSYTVQVNIVNGTGSTAKADLSTDPDLGPPAGPPYPAGGHPLPRSWVTLSGPYKAAARSTVSAPVTIHVPSGAPAGRYGTTIQAHSYGSPRSGNGAAFGGGGAAWLEVSVGVPPPPKAFCDGSRATYWPPVTPLPTCKTGQPPLKGRQVVCGVLPLPPPAVGARNCHMPAAQWRQYVGQLKAAGQRYAHNPQAYLKDAWCVVNGRILNRNSYYARSGVYRSGGGGAARFRQGQVADARSTTSG